VREFVDIEGVKGMAAAIEDAPQLILLKKLPRGSRIPFSEVILDGLEGQFTDDFEFKGGGTHELVDYLAILNEV
jgi:hypothetical protein